MEETGAQSTHNELEMSGTSQAVTDGAISSSGGATSEEYSYIQSVNVVVTNARAQERTTLKWKLSEHANTPLVTQL